MKTTSTTSITNIIQRKVKTFTKERYFDLYEDILRDEITSLTNTNGDGYNSSEETLIKQVKDYESINIIKKKDIWRMISNNMFTYDNKYNYTSCLVVKYLKMKVKLIVQKILYISIKHTHSIEFVLRKYLDICRYEMKKIKVIRLNNLKLLKQRNSFINNNNNNSNNNNVNTNTNKNERMSRRGTIRALSGDIIHKKNSNTFQTMGTQISHSNNKLLNDDEEGEVEEQHTKPLNLFIGDFNIKSFKEHNQTVYLKKYDNISTFIFVNKEDPTNPTIKNNPHSRTIISKKGGNKHTVSMPKIYGKLGAVNIHRFDTFGFLENDFQSNKERIIHSRNYKKKHNRICVTSGNNVNTNTNNYTNTLPTKKSIDKSKRLSIKIGNPPEIIYTHTSNHNGEYKKTSLNLFKRKNKIGCNYNNTNNNNNENIVSYNKQYRLKSPMLMTKNDSLYKHQGLSVILSSPISKKNMFKNKSKTRNKVKLINFFTKTDLYY